MERRKGKERKGKERKGKERKGMEGEGRGMHTHAGTPTRTHACGELTVIFVEEGEDGREGRPVLWILRPTRRDQPPHGVWHVRWHSGPRRVLDNVVHDPHVVHLLPIHRRKGNLARDQFEQNHSEAIHVDLLVVAQTLDQFRRHPGGRAHEA